MIYDYKPKNKFPHVVYFDWQNQNWAIKDFDEIMNPWCRENIGVYQKTWFCPAQRYGNFRGAPYAFKTKVDAMAFKLRWL